MLLNHTESEIISNFVSSKNSDPTMLSFDFIVNDHSILFCKDDVINVGSISFYDNNCILNDFGENIVGVVSTPHILLKELGETNRDKLLLMFIDGFLEVIKNQQWRIQTIEGIDNVFQTMLNYKEAYTGSSDEKITISCLEDVELTMYNLFEMYRRAIYDPLYKRQLIPDNLLQFDCAIVISDRRIIKNFTADKTNIPNKEYSKNTVLNKVGNTFKHTKTEDEKQSNDVFEKPQVIIKLCNCKFDLSSIGKSFESINPSEVDNNYVTYNFSFTFGKVYMESSYIQNESQWEKFNKEQDNYNNGASLDEFISNNSENKTLSSLIAQGWDGAFNSAKTAGKEYLDNIIENQNKKILSKVDRISKTINGTQQGYEVGENVYGKSNFINAFIKDAASDVSSFIDVATDKLINSIEGTANSAINKTKSKIDNAINTAESSIINGSKKSNTTNGFQKENVFGDNEQTETKEKFEPFNVYKNVPSGPTINQ